MDNIFCGLVILIFLLVVSFAKIEKIAGKEHIAESVPWQTCTSG